MMMSIRPSTTIRRLAALLALSAATVGGAAACSDATRGGEPGRLSILLTDAPGDFRHAVVTIDRIYLVGASDSTDRVVLREEDVTTDLLTLADSTAELVRDASIPAGRYSQLRFVISGGYVEVENADGSTSVYASSPDYLGLPAGTSVDGPLQMPSYAQSGLKVRLPGDAPLDVEGDQRVLLVDFDVSRSFGREAGGSGRWVMSPVLEATAITATGSLLATVTKADSVTLPAIDGAALSLADFRAVLSTAAGTRETRALTDANGDGAYEAEFRYLVPGTFTLDLEAASDSVTVTTAPAHPLAVSVGSGQAQQRALVVTSARK